MTREWDKDKERERKREYRARKKREASGAPESVDGTPTPPQPVVESQQPAQTLLEYAEEIGRRHGSAEADSRGETGAKREARIKRAINYQYFLLEEGRSPA